MRSPQSRPTRAAHSWLHCILLGVLAGGCSDGSSTTGQASSTTAAAAPTTSESEAGQAQAPARDATPSPTDRLNQAKEMGAAGAVPSSALDAGAEDGDNAEGDGGATAACDRPREEIDVEAFPECDLCELARCVPQELVHPHEAELLAACDNGRLCVPERLLRTGGAFVPPTCRSLGGAEGRCLSLCVPAVAEQAERLPQDLCDDDQRCAPCVEPTTGEATPACSLSCDTGPAEASVLFDGCCEGRGTCVPAALAGDDAENLPGMECEDRGEPYVCAPNEKVEDSDYRFPSCKTVVDCTQAEDETAQLGCETGGLGLVPLSDQPGACVPRCILAEREPTAGLHPHRVYQQGSCAEGEACAPCEIPTVGPSGVCD